MPLLIGWSEKSITPDKKIAVYGQFAERISEYVEKPLTVTALALEKDGDQAVLVSCDLAETKSFLTAAVRAALADNDLGLDPAKISFNAIHTHTGPNYADSASASDGSSNMVNDMFHSLRNILSEFLQPGQQYVEAVNISDSPDIATEQEIYDLLVVQLKQVILDAWKNRKPGSFSNAFGRAVVGQCRRAAYNDNTAQMWGDTNTAVFEALEGGNDSGLELLYFFDENRKLTGVVANTACPAQCVQHRHFISPDFWGEVKMLLRKHFGEELYLLPQCSIAGDQCPVDLVRWVQPETDINDPNCTRSNPPKRKADPSMFDLAGMRKAGKRVASEIIEVWNEGLDDPQTDPVLEHRVLNMQLPIRRATLTDVRNAKTAIKDYLRDLNGRNLDYMDLGRLQVYLGVLIRAQVQEKEDTMDTEVHIIRLGTIAIATNPFEPFLDYGNQIKARSAAEQTFLIQLANGSCGYIPTEKAEVHGHYSAFIASGNVGHMGGEQMVRETLQNIRQMFAE